MTEEEKIEQLKLKRKVAYIKLRHSYQMWTRALQLFKSIEARYKLDKKEWESLDRQLAMLDGRLHVLPAPGTRIKREIEIKESDLTEEQIGRLAKALGVSLVDVPDEEEGEKASGQE